MERINYSSGAKWEDVVGYSRAVRMGNMIEITGTVAVDENDQLVGGNDAYAQTRYIIQKIEKVLKRAGAGLEHVIRTRMFVTDVSKWEEVAKVHGEVFANIRPATTIVEVARLIDGDALIEIEADAVVG